VASIYFPQKWIQVAAASCSEVSQGVDFWKIKHCTHGCPSSTGNVGKLLDLGYLGWIFVYAS